MDRINNEHNHLDAFHSKTIQNKIFTCLKNNNYLVRIINPGLDAQTHPNCYNSYIEKLKSKRFNDLTDTEKGQVYRFLSNIIKNIKKFYPTIKINRPSFGVSLELLDSYPIIPGEHFNWSICIAILICILAFILYLI